MDIYSKYIIIYDCIILYICIYIYLVSSNAELIAVQSQTGDLYIWLTKKIASENRLHR
jgi:hypothetical protein